LFINPMYMATYRIYRQFGKEYVQELIRRTCDNWRLPESLRGGNYA
jgi:hypothetical protein